MADSRGIPDFGLLHADLAAGRKDRLLYYAFDLLYLDGLDLRPARLTSDLTAASQPPGLAVSAASDPLPPPRYNCLHSVRAAYAA